MKRNNYLKLIIIATILYAIVMVCLQYFSNQALYNTYTPDFTTYIEAAKDLFYNGKVHTIRPIGIAAFVSTPLYFGASINALPTIIWVMQFCLWLLQIIIIYKTASLIVKPRIAYITAILFIINFSNMLHTTVILSETFCSFLLCCVAYFVVQFYIHKKNYLAFASILLCIAALVRPTFVYASVILSIVAIVYFIKHKHLLAINTCIIGLALLCMQCYKMQKQFGNFTVSYINKAALISYLDVRAKQYKNNTTYTQEIAIVNTQLQNLTPSQFSNIALHDFKTQLQSNTFNLVRAYAYNLFENSTTGCSMAKDMHSQKALSIKVSSKIIRFISKLQNTIYSFCVLIFLPFWFYKYAKNISKELKKIFVALWLICFYTIMLSAFSFYQHDRFHIIIVPQVLVLIAIAWQSTLIAKPPTQKAS